jgi:UDP-GlcNAc:undecaprenyl-phosphate GlcNAc-1-phosphate transferase
MIADRKHLHYRLLDFGFSHKKAVIFLWLVSLSFGLIGLLFPTTKIKIFALIFLIIFMIILAILVTGKNYFKLKT